MDEKRWKWFLALLIIVLIFCLPANFEVFFPVKSVLKDTLSGFGIVSFAITLIYLFWLILTPSKSERAEENFLKKRNKELEALLLEKDTALTAIKVKLENEIADFKKAELKSWEISQELRELTAQIESIREEERTRIAREVHDELGQQLTCLKMDIAWLNKKMEEGPELNEKLNSMLDLIDDTIKSVRRISTELRPGILDDLGLAAAIEWQCEEFEKRNEIHCSFKNEVGDMQFSRPVSTAVFRIVQEALTNVMRHSKADEIQVLMKIEENDLLLEIKDNGKGITEADAKKGNLGLLGIKERVSLLGGDCEIKGKENEGTIISLHIPMAA